MTRAFTLLDGGMGKALHAAGAPFGQPEWSALALMDGPEWVTRVHGEFIEAGADVIITNNYAVVPFHLGEERFAALGAELTDMAGRLAREAADGADRPVKVAGSLPPIFGSYRPDLFDADRAPELLTVVVDALAPHVDLWLAETQSLVAEAAASARAAAGHGLPIWLAMTLADEHHGEVSHLRSGESVTAAARLAGEVGAQALLFNCSHPEVMLPAIVEARSALPDHIEVGAYANAFEPAEARPGANEAIRDHRADLDDGGYLPFVESWLDAGATIVGGCCGIMPRHIGDLSRMGTAN